MVAVFVLDRQRRCGFINTVAELLTGLSLAQARKRPFAEVLWPKDPLQFERTAIARALADKAGGEGEEAITDRSGVRRPFSFRVVPLGSGGGGGRVVELVDLSGETGTARALRESEHRLRLAVEATGIGIWDVNAVTGERQWSDEFKEIIGLPPEAEADDTVFASLLHPDDRQRIVTLYRRAYTPESGGAYSAEFRIVRARDGAVRWVVTTGRITFDSEGRPLRGVGTLRDIHERRLSEEAVRESEERLRVALVAGRMGTWRYDLRTGEQRWDTTQYRVMGVDPSVTPTRELFLSMVHPDDLHKVTFDLESVPVSSFLDSEFRVFRPDGQLIWINANAMARTDANGVPIEMIGVNRDITAQKEAAEALRVSEERHRLAVEANEVGTWDFDMVSHEHRWSDKFKELWGLPPDAPADYGLLRPLVDDADWEMVLAHWAKASEGDGRISLEYRIRRADDGARRWCMFSGQIFFDEGTHRPLRAVGIMMDVTDRREAEERQRLIVRELNHRVKNSLAVVQAIVSQTIRMSPDPEVAFERIQARLMAVSRTHDFLNQSNWGGASLMDLLKGELEPYTAKDAVQVSLHGPFVRLESTTALALGLVFHELATNAAKYGSISREKGRLEVSWKVWGDDPSPDIEIVWRERDGPPLGEPRRKGFGSRLIEGSVSGNLDGKVAFDYAPEGLTCRMTFTLRPLIHDAVSAAGAKPGQSAALAVGGTGASAAGR